MDLFDQEVRERTLPMGHGVPEFEALLLLTLAKEFPGSLKGDLALRAGGCRELERVWLKYIDCLVGTQALVRLDFRFYLTPTGEKRLMELQTKLRSQINLIWNASLGK